MTTYPSQVAVTSDREAFGRLRSLTPNVGDPLVTSATYATATAPGTLAMGAGGSVVRNDVYDYRKRLLSRTYSANGTNVAELRYAYDGADREVAQQALHRGGRTRFVGYDADSRLSWAEVDARPETSEVGQGWAPRTGVLPGRWQAGEYARDYHYDTVGEDRVEAVVSTAWPQEVAPPTATTLASPDLLGAIREVDGVPRGRDGLGNITSTPTGNGVETLEYDGQSRLRRVVRPDGAEITYTYRSDGPLVARHVTCPPDAQGCVASDRTYVYDGLLLLEEYEGSGAARHLVARYYYADEGDIPLGADLWDPNTNTLERRYFVVDRVGSILGVLDASGTWLETIDYDPWGRPTVTPADHVGPALRSIETGASGELLLIFSEPVLPPPDRTQTDPATNLVTELAPLEGALEVTDAFGQPVEGALDLLDQDGTHRRGTVLRFVPATPLVAATAYTLTLSAGGLLDRRGNPITAAAATLTAGPGTRYIGGNDPTEPEPVERSLTNNSLLFQSHLYDYDADLYQARARTYDPHTGTFLQLDPSGYDDSVNSYSGFRSDPVNQRDPTGRATEAEIRECMRWFSRGRCIDMLTGGIGKIPEHSVARGVDINLVLNDTNVNVAGGLGGALAWIIGRIFTKDPIKLNAASRLGAAADGLGAAAAGVAPAIRARMATTADRAGGTNSGVGSASVPGNTGASDLPHVQQKESTACGPACGEMASVHIARTTPGAKTVDQATLLRQPEYDATRGGMHPDGLEAAMNRVAPAGIRRWTAGDPLPRGTLTAALVENGLTRALTEGGGVAILMVKKPMTGGGSYLHFVVARDVADGAVTIHDPELPQPQVLPVTAEGFGSYIWTGDMVTANTRY